MMIYTQNTFLYDKNTYSVGLTRSSFTNYYFLKNRYFGKIILFHEYLIPLNKHESKEIKINIILNFDNKIIFFKKKNFLKINFVFN